MAEFIQGTQLRTLLFGRQVVKAAATIPQTATGTLFTVSGGAVLVTSLTGVVTTVIGGTATTLALGLAPTVGTASTSGIATATAITSKEVGTYVVPLVGTAGAPGALVVGTNAGTTVFDTPEFVASAGTITWTTSASTTGAMKWYISYVPLDDGASVA